MMSYLDTTKYSLDWLQGVLPFSDVRALFQALGDIDDRLKYENWSVMGGLRNYRTRFICQGKPSVSIAYNDDVTLDPFNKSLWHTNQDNTEVGLLAEDHPYNPGIFVSISGDGLRWLNTVPGTVEGILKYMRLQSFKCSRLDLACDVFEPDNELVPTVLEAFKYAIARQDQKNTIKSNMRRTSGKKGSVRLYPYTDTIRDPEGQEIWNCSFGDHGSFFGMFRCYDKWFEIASGRLATYSQDMLGTLPHQYWYRLEYELHSIAGQIFNALADGELNVQTAFGTSAKKMFSIVFLKHRNYDLSHSPIDSVWEQFLAYTIHFV